MLPKNANYFFRPAFLLVISANVVIITNEGGVADELVRGYRFFFFCAFGYETN
jgi:hypothetical protein